MGDVGRVPPFPMYEIHALLAYRTELVGEQLFDWELGILGVGAVNCRCQRHTAASVRIQVRVAAEEIIGHCDGGMEVVMWVGRTGRANVFVSFVV